MLKSLVLGISTVLILSTGVMGQSKEEAAVTAAAAALTKAMLDGDQQALEKYTSKSLSYGHSSGKIDDQSQFISALIKGNTDFTSIDITDQTIRIAGKMAIVRNTFAGKLTVDGKPLEIKIGILMVWKNAKGNWKLLARQGYKL